MVSWDPNCAASAFARHRMGTLALLFVAGVATRAAAHGEPAAVLGAARFDAQGQPVWVRLSEGLAVREGTDFRYLCPALFDSEGTPRLAAAAQGPAIAASERGVFLVGDDGQVSRHPDSALETASLTALDADTEAAFGLRSVDGSTELLRINATSVQVIAQVADPLTSLVVDNDVVVAAGLGSGGSVLQRGFTPHGEELAALRVDATGPLDAVAIFARSALGRSFMVALNASLGSELAHVDAQGHYVVLQQAGLLISGPIAADSTHTLLAFGGDMAQLHDDQVLRVQSDVGVHCVGRVGTVAYACTRDELVRVRIEEGMLGPRLFGLDQIVPPHLEGFDPQLAERCGLQWLRFRADLVRAGILPNGTLDAGTNQDAGGMAHKARTELRDASTGLDSERASDASGCAVTVAPGHHTRGGRSSGVLLATLAWCALRCKRERERARLVRRHRLRISHPAFDPFDPPLVRVWKFHSGRTSVAVNVQAQLALHLKAAYRCARSPLSRTVLSTADGISQPQPGAGRTCASTRMSG